MGNIQSRVALLLKGSLAPNTIKTYQTSISVFKKFCKQYSFKLQLPFQTRHVVLFISYCFEWGCTPATTRTYVSGLSFYHKINGFHDPTDAFIITKLLEGCRRSRNTTDSRSPITLDILRKVLTSLTAAIVTMKQNCFTQPTVLPILDFFVLANWCTPTKITSTARCS